MDSLAETSMNADVVQDVVVVQYAKIPLDLINVLANLDSKVSSKFGYYGEALKTMPYVH